MEQQLPGKGCPVLEQDLTDLVEASLPGPKPAAREGTRGEVKGGGVIKVTVCVCVCVMLGWAGVTKWVAGSPSFA